MVVINSVNSMKILNFVEFTSTYERPFWKRSKVHVPYLRRKIFLKSSLACSNFLFKSTKDMLGSIEI